MKKCNVVDFTNGKVLFFTVVLSLFLCANSIFGGIIYVWPGATGANDGSTWPNAYHTLSLAYNQALMTPDADEIRIARGVLYINDDYPVPSDVTIKGGYKEYTETRDIFSNPTILTTTYYGGYLLSFDGTSNSTFDGITFQNPAGRDLVAVTGSAGTVINFWQCIFDGGNETTYYGTIVGGTVQFEYCDFINYANFYFMNTNLYCNSSHLTNSPLSTDNVEGKTVISSTFTNSRLTVSNSYSPDQVYLNYNTFIDSEVYIGCINGEIRNTTYISNTYSAVTRDFEIQVSESSGNVLFSDALFYGNELYDVCLNTDEGLGGTIDLRHLTIAGNCEIFSLYPNTSVTNSILWGDTNFMLDYYPLDAPDINYSCIKGGFSGGVGNTASDPQFKDPANNDFRLQAASPCIDAADTTKSYYQGMSGGYIDIRTVPNTGITREIVVRTRIGTGDGSSVTFSGNLQATLAGDINPGSFLVYPQGLTDDGSGNFIDGVGNDCGDIDYSTGEYSITFPIPPYSGQIVEFTEYGILQIADIGYIDYVPEPVVDITAPLDTAVVEIDENVTIMAEASEATAGISMVEFAYEKNGESVVFGWDFDTTDDVYSVDTVFTETGEYTITCKAYGSLNGWTISEPVTITVSEPAPLPPVNDPPSVSIANVVRKQSFVYVYYTIYASAADSDGTVSKVEFYCNSQKIYTDTSAPYSYKYRTTIFQKPPFTFEVKATDNEGAETWSDPVIISR